MYTTASLDTVPCIGSRSVVFRCSSASVSSTCTVTHIVIHSQDSQSRQLRPCTIGSRTLRSPSVSRPAHQIPGTTKSSTQSHRRQAIDSIDLSCMNLPASNCDPHLRRPRRASTHRLTPTPQTRSLSVCEERWRARVQRPSLSYIASPRRPPCASSRRLVIRVGLLGRCAACNGGFSLAACFSTREEMQSRSYLDIRRLSSPS